MQVSVKWSYNHAGCYIKGGVTIQDYGSLSAMLLAKLTSYLLT